MKKEEIILLTPGPTTVSETVLKELSKSRLNSDVDLNFYEDYYQVAKKLKKITNSDLDFLLLAGEGMLGLDAALNSMVEASDKVLCLDNGVFGKGFEDLAKLYSNNVTRWQFDYQKGIDIHDLEARLMESHDFTIATLVHVDTPTGVVNNIAKIAKVLKKYNIYVIVDAVSGIGGDLLDLSDSNVDILLGASQKVISAPVGITIVGVSASAWLKMEGRKQPINSFYCNLLLFKDWYSKKWFPYTMPAHLIYALSKALDELKTIEYYELMAFKVRNKLKELGLNLYLNDNYSNSLTAFLLPPGIEVNYLINTMLNKYKIMISSSIGDFQNLVIRIGHMGSNANQESLDCFFSALKEILLLAR